MKTDRQYLMSPFFNEVITIYYRDGDTFNVVSGRGYGTENGWLYYNPAIDYKFTPRQSLDGISRIKVDDVSRIMTFPIDGPTQSWSPKEKVIPRQERAAG